MLHAREERRFVCSDFESRTRKPDGDRASDSETARREERDDGGEREKFAAEMMEVISRRKKERQETRSRGTRFAVQQPASAGREDQSLITRDGNLDFEHSHSHTHGRRSKNNDD